MQFSKAEVEGPGRGKGSTGPSTTVFKGTQKAREGEKGDSSARPGLPVEVEDSSDEGDEDEDDPIVMRIPLYFNSAPDFTLPTQGTGFDPEEFMDAEDDSSKDPTPRPPHGLGSVTLLQYPHRPADPTNPHSLLPPSLRPSPSLPALASKIHARYKPGVRQLQLDVPMEVKAGIAEDRFSEDRAREFARGLPAHQQKGSGKGKRKERHNEWADWGAEDDEDSRPDPLSRLTLQSTLIPEQTHYLIGIHKPGDPEDESDPGSMHLIPLAQTLQLRPHLEYLDGLQALEKSGSKGRRGGGDDDDEGSEDGEGGEGEGGTKKKDTSGARAVQVSIANANQAGDRGNTRGGMSLFTPLRAAEAEPWVHLEHYHSETRESQMIREKLYCTKPDNVLEPTSSWRELLKV